MMLILTIISVLLGATGQVLVKIGARHLQLDYSGATWPSVLAIFKNLPVMSGMLLYALSFLLWIKVLSQTELSYAYPMVALGYVVVLTVSYFFLHEQVNAYRLAGVAFIVFGVILVARS